MQDFSTTDNWVFDLGDKPPVDIPGQQYSDLPYISEPDRWEQYSNQFVYEFDRLLRQWFERMCQNQTWVKSYKKRRYTMSMMIEQLYGRKYDNAKDGSNTRIMAKILAYYSSRIQKAVSINGKHYSKTAYVLSPTRYHGMVPYSLKLRLEWYAERGILPTQTNMCLPTDNLKPGHARRGRTEANMQRMREEGRKRYNERYADRAH